ncbi:MAG: long-chain acyl-CoA synthetase [Acidimicrobiaceae bacterium]|jgi:long-chain acyl-CoA synthetase|nr:long-chain acyl-CoA synthetase [Acidimicrobiaceae bacterium]
MKGSAVGTQATKDDIDRMVAGETVPTLFLKLVDTFPNDVALRWRQADDSWGTITFAQYKEQALRLATGLRELGVGPGDRVVLMIRNRPEFHVADMAALFLGATPISVYNSSSPEQVQYLVSHCEATVAIVEDSGFLERFVKVRSELPALRHIAVIEDAGGVGDDVLWWSDLLDRDPLDEDQARSNATPEGLATVIYTSGTTGPPKGVMLTHYNVAWTAQSLRLCYDKEDIRGLRVVSYLPMAHIAERMTSHYQGAVFGYEITTCPEASMIGAYLRDVHPQIAFGVPRIWEKVHAGVRAAVSSDADRKQKLDDAVAAAMPIARKRTAGEPLTDEEQQTWDFLDSVAFAPLREMIGLDAVELAITGAAPIPVELIDWYRAIGVPLSEIYGMSENSGPLTWAPYRVKAGYVGPALPGVTVKLAEDGEVLGRGGNIFTGYLKDPDKTAEALDDEGWLHTGDIGEFDDEGYLKIVDRKKELIITAGGKNISPANIEAALKSFPLIGQAAVIGDRRPFISALIVLDPEVAPAWAKQQGIETATPGDLTELAEHPDVHAEVERSVNEANLRFSNVERVKKFTILAEEWQPDSEELTPTMKLKRRGINAKYAAEIEAIYSK